MKKITGIICLACMALMPLTSCGQSSLSISTPLIYSKVTAKNNWSPPTAVNRQNQFDGTAIGSGVNLGYSFQPKLIIKDKHFFVNIGAGYFKQRFNLQRPFDYNTPLYPVYFTDYYVYQCWLWSAGITYNLLLNNKYLLSGDLLYNQLFSFQQEYTPYTSANRPTQVNNHNIDFAKTITLSLGVQRKLGKQFTLGLDLLLPYTRWRNDRIFKDDPATFSHPNFSLGTSVSIAYHLKKKNQS
ncbi:MAG: hypothetical protein QY309_07115 [Cyclobacteriaceae bacterium]|nr:MAG: hypothetical protein QY309_07115 [Cyclobacteriaceae bacterium]